MNEILHLLQMTKTMIECGEPDRAAWRLADAGFLLRQQLEGNPLTDPGLIGLNTPTGRGVKLPQRNAPKR